jgi:hypothetical protein
VAQLEQLAAEGGDGCVCSDRHDGRVKGVKGRWEEEVGKLTFLWWGEMVPHEGKVHIGSMKRDNLSRIDVV